MRIKKRAPLHNALSRPAKAYTEHANDAPVYQEHRLSCVSVYTKLAISIGTPKERYLIIQLLIELSAMCRQIDKKSSLEMRPGTDRIGQRRTPVSLNFLALFWASYSQLYRIGQTLQRNYLQKCHNSCLASASPPKFRPAPH